MIAAPRLKSIFVVGIIAPVSASLFVRDKLPRKSEILGKVVALNLCISFWVL